MMSSFLLVKMVHTVNAVAQWVWLNESLKSTRYPYWGFSILGDLMKGNDWQVGQEALVLYTFVSSRLILSIDDFSVFLSLITIFCILQYFCR